jgi:hypothetical protein
VGQHLTRDLAQAFQGLKQACDGGVGDACLELGAVFETGDGIARDQQRALALYKQACAAGKDQACAKVKYR